jgi:hypothetical protein
MPRQYPPLTAYRVTRSDGSSYVTDMAADVTLADARAYFVGARQETDDGTVTVTDVDTVRAPDTTWKATPCPAR